MSCAKGRSDENQPLVYPVEICRAARLLGYGEASDMGDLLGASVAAGLSEFGRQNAYLLVQVGVCTADNARAAQEEIVEYASATVKRLQADFKKRSEVDAEKLKK